MNVSTSSEQSWLSKTKKNNLANNSLMVLVTPQLRLFSAFGIKQIHQSSGLQKKSREGRIVAHGCSALPFGSWQQPVTIIWSHTTCIHCIHSPYPLPTSPSLPTHCCILLTKASNFLPFHGPSPLSIHMWSLFSFWKFSDSFPTFRLFSNYSSPHPQLKVLWQRQTLARCFASFMSALLGPERMLAEYWISSEIIQLQWKLPIYKPLCILTVHTQYNFLSCESGTQLLRVAKSLLCFNTVFPVLLCKAVGAISSLK